MERHYIGDKFCVMLLAIQLPSHLSTTTFLVATLNRANEAFVVHVIIFAQATQHSQHLKLYGWTIPRTAATIQVLVAGYTASLTTGEHIAARSNYTGARGGLYSSRNYTAAHR